MDDDTDKTPLENPTGKEWFAPNYVPRAKPAENILRRNFGPGLPPRDDDGGPTEGEVDG